jgi:hypothetical protein
MKRKKAYRQRRFGSILFSTPGAKMEIPSQKGNPAEKEFQR